MFRQSGPAQQEEGCIKPMLSVEKVRPISLTSEKGGGWRERKSPRPGGHAGPASEQMGPPMGAQCENLPNAKQCGKVGGWAGGF